MAKKKEATQDSTRAKLAARFPAEDHDRVKKGGGWQTYVSAEKILDRADDVLGWDWSSRVIREGMTNTEAYALVEITAIIDGKTVVRQQFGTCPLMRGQYPATNVMKIAGTDGIKKALTLLGVCRYLYDDDEREEVEAEMRAEDRAQAQTNAPPDRKPTPIKPTENGTRKCQAITDDPHPGDTCPNVVPAGEAVMASMREFNKPLCEEHLTRNREFIAARKKAAEALRQAETVPNEPVAPVSDDPIEEIKEAVWGRTLGENAESAVAAVTAPDASKQPTAAPTASKPAKAADTAVILPPTSTGRQCQAMRGPNRDKQCDVILYPGTGEPYNGRNVRAEQIIERSTTQFGRVFCGAHYLQAVEHKRRVDATAGQATG